MRALTVAPSVANSARGEDITEPTLSAGRTLALQVCATDREIGVHGGERPAESGGWSATNRSAA